MPSITTNEIQALIQTKVHEILTVPLMEQSKFLSLPGLKVVDSASPVTFPRLTGHGKVSRVGQSQPIPESDGPKADESMTLLQSSIESYKSIIRVANEALRSSSQALDSVLTDALVRDFQAAIDTDAFSSKGDGVKSAKGLLHKDWALPTINVGTADSAKPVTFDVLHDALGTVLGNDAPTEGLKWVLDPATLVSLRKLKDGQGRYLLDESVAATPGGATLLGVPVVVTKRIEAGAKGKRVLLLNPASVAVVRDTAPTVKILTETYADYDETGIRVTARYDWGYLESNANVLIDGIA